MSDSNREWGANTDEAIRARNAMSGLLIRQGSALGKFIPSTEPPEQSELPTILSTIQRIAAIAHHGGLIGYKDEASALREICRLSLKYWDKTESTNLRK